MTFWDKIKQNIWHVIYRFFPHLERFARIFRRDLTRQRYFLGWLAPGKTLEQLKSHLSKEWGFGNHFVAWVDPGQILSWRKLTSFHDQYHLRIFEDGEIRGHFELTPEAHPFDHFSEKGEEERREDFLKYLGDFVTQEKNISYLEADQKVFDHRSQHTIYKVKDLKNL